GAAGGVAAHGAVAAAARDALEGADVDADGAGGLAEARRAEGAGGALRVAAAGAAAGVAGAGGALRVGGALLVHAHALVDVGVAVVVLGVGDLVLHGRGEDVGEGGLDVDLVVGEARGAGAAVLGHGVERGERGVVADVVGAAGVAEAVAGGAALRAGVARAVAG